MQSRQIAPSSDHSSPPATQTTSSAGCTAQVTIGSSALATTVSGQSTAARVSRQWRSGL